MPDHLKQLQQACAYLRWDGRSGSGYLIQPTLVATCRHVVRSRDGRIAPEVRVYLGPERDEMVAKPVEISEDNDCAILELERAAEVPPLPLARSLERKAEWLSYGFPGVARRAPVVIEGSVLIPSVLDNRDCEAIQLFSPMIAAGNATMPAGFSGSPVYIEGAVVGHLTKHLGDPDDPRRPSFGVLYACPSNFVLELTGEPGVVLDLPDDSDGPPAIPAVPAGGYHAFLSYSHRNKQRAREIARRLTGAGLDLFLDDRELRAGDRLAQRLQDAMASSHGAIVLLSEPYLASSWCQEELNILVTRAVETDGFRLVPIRLDDAELPLAIASRLWVDLRGGRAVDGAAAREIVQGLTDPVGDGDAPAVDAVEAGRLAAVDAALDRLAAAKNNGAYRVWDLWKDLRHLHAEDDTPALLAAEILLGQGRPQWALEILERAGDRVRVQQLRALAYARTDRDNKAIELLEALRLQGARDSETLGILAGRYKQRWARSGDTGALEASRAIYQEAYDETGSPYVGINVAAILLLQGQRPAARKVALAVSSALEGCAEAQRSHWDLATLGEAYLINEDLEAARTWYRRAVGNAPTHHQDIAVMRKQARLELLALGLEPGALDDILVTPTVVAFSGHMTDATGRAEPRFPEERVPRVRAAIRDWLRTTGPVHGFCSAARGSDLLFLRELLDRGGTAHVVLPFPRDAFRITSVGHGWDRDFDQVLSHDHVEVTELLAVRPEGQEREEGAYDECNRFLREESIAYAGAMGSPVRLLCVNHGESGGRGGTRDALGAWRRERFDADEEITILDPLEV